jgi:hypothetical protein
MPPDDGIPLPDVVCWWENSSGEGGTMSLGTILILIVVIYLVGGLSGRIGGYGYGMGHSGMGIGIVILVVLIILLSLHKL